MKRIVGILFALFVLMPLACNSSPGDGEKIGQIIKVSRTGMLRKTWECQLIRGGMNGGSGSFGVTPFDFTISDMDSELLAAAKQAMEKQTEVLVKYHTAFFYGCSSDDGHFAASITPAKP